MKDCVFIDSNIWLYSFFPEDEMKFKKITNFISETYKSHTVVISYQVINEVCFNLKKKKFAEDKINEVIKSFEKECKILNFSIEILTKASDLRAKHNFSFWDSIVIASAILSECKKFFSEDMQDGRKIEGLQIENPLKIFNVH